jgi:hypothetical protein
MLLLLGTLPCQRQRCAGQVIREVMDRKLTLKARYTDDGDIYYTCRIKKCLWMVGL